MQDQSVFFVNCPSRLRLVLRSNYTRYVIAFLRERQRIVTLTIDSIDIRRLQGLRQAELL